MKRTFSRRSSLCVAAVGGLAGLAIVGLAEVSPAGAVTPVTQDKVTATLGVGAVSVSVTNTVSELAIAWVSADSASAGLTATVSGGGLTWHLAARANTQGGDAEAWWADTAGASFTATATPSTSGKSTQLTVITYSGSSSIGATKTGSAAHSATSVVLTPTSNGSQVGGVGMDYDNATARTLASGQVMDRQDTDSAGDTYWVQHATAATTAGTAVTISDTAPTNDQWNFVAVEAAPIATATPTPTPTPTATPTPTPTAYPSASTTGPAAGGYTGLTTYTGPTTITTAGTVITGKIINGPLTINAANVTVQGSIITANNAAPQNGGAPVLGVNADGANILYDTIQGVSTSAPANDGVKLYANNVTFKANNIQLIADDGITLVGTNLNLSDNYLHGFVDRAGVHFDGVVYDSSTSNTVLIQHNTLQMWVTDASGNPIDMNHVVNTGPSAPNTTVNNNLIAGGGFSVSGAATFTNNKFSTTFNSNCGYYGTHDYTTGATWTNNTWYDGPNAGTVIPL